MHTVSLFDIDGTLTPSRRPMLQDFAERFADWCESNSVYVVTGNDYPKVLEQLPETVLRNVDGVFTCSGAEFWLGGNRVWANDWTCPANLLTYFNELKELSRYPYRFGTHVEERTGMVNVSVVGRQADMEYRRHYRQWDEENGERLQIVSCMQARHPELEYSIGGDISIDIAPAGGNKSQILKVLDKRHPRCVYTFFGDRMQPGGNDRPLALALEKRGGANRSHAVETHECTALALGLYPDILSHTSAMTNNVAA